jgi:hypothetical protein
VYIAGIAIKTFLGIAGTGMIHGIIPANTPTDKYPLKNPGSNGEKVMPVPGTRDRRVGIRA